MSREEQLEVKKKYYHEAIRYMDNASEYLKNARKEDGRYQDRKYIKTACGTAYNGVLVALDGYLLVKGVEKPKRNSRKSIEFYREQVGKIDRKLLGHLNDAYEILHLWGYYDGIQKAEIVKSGFDDAYAIIEKIKPMQAA